MEFTLDNYLTIALCLIIYTVIGAVVYMHLKAGIVKNRTNLDLLRKEHELLKEEVGNVVTDIKTMIKDDRLENRSEHDTIITHLTQMLRDDRGENRGSHELIAKGLSNVAVNVGELRNEIKKLTEK